MKKKNQSPIRIVSTILGSFFLAFLAFGLYFTFGIKSSKVSAQAKEFVEALGTRSALDVINELAMLRPTTPSIESTENLIVDVSIGETDVTPEEPTKEGVTPTQSDPVTPTNPQPTTPQPQEPLLALKNELNKQLDENTVTNLSQQEQIEVHRIFTDTIFFGDSMTQAIGDWGFVDKANVIYQRSATIKDLLAKTYEVAACYPVRVILFTGLNDCNYYPDSVAYRTDYEKLIDQLRAQIPGVQICVSSLLPPSNVLAASRPDLARAPIYDMELRDLCAKKNVYYIDSTWMVRQQNYNKDGIHMTRTFYRVWFRYLKAIFG